MFRNRRFACLFLGLWLGASAAVDVLVTLSASAGNGFVAAPGSPYAKAQIKQMGEKTTLFILRRNATEEAAWIFEVWGWVQIGLATALFLLILFGDRPPRSALVIVPVILLILLLQHFVVTPNMVSLGRDVDEIPAAELVRNPYVAQFSLFRWAQLICEILKFVLGFGVGGRLMIRRTSERTQREYDRELAPVSPSQPDRIRKRRKTDHNG